MENEKLHQLALHFIPGIGHFFIKQLISYCGSAEAVFTKNKGYLSKIPGVGPKLINAIQNHKTLLEAEKEFEKAQKKNIRILSYTDKEFPKRLKGLHDAPAILYSKGAADLNNQKCIAIVGTRRATPYGKDFTNDLIASLAPHNPLIISGLAYGIDIAAHRAALKHNIATIGVMASGIDVIYPAIHRETALGMTENGGLITELKIGTSPEAVFFPARNRIIAGMADATIVIEAAKKGGALITAEIANSYNRDVFAVPGNVGQASSEGCNNLIKHHKANTLTSIKDIEYIMNWEPGTGASPVSFFNLDDTLFDNDEKTVVQHMIDKKNDGILLDELSWHTQIPVSKLASILLNLEFKGAVNSLPGKKYKIAGR
ncbi:MAG: DNA-processing protein DprA [Candidatus Cyclobacteriaceae bacterium M2_1C_046]